MISRKHKIGAVCILLIALLFSACYSKIKYTVEPPAPISPTGPLIMEEEQLLINTKSAIEDGNPEFWKSAGESYFPNLHPRYSSVDSFVSEMDKYTSVFNFQCQAVLRYPWMSYSGEVQGQIVSLVLTGSGNDSYQEAADEYAVLVPELGVFEVRFLREESIDSAFYLQGAGFIAANGDTVEELYQFFISSRKAQLNKDGFKLHISPCP